MQTSQFFHRHSVGICGTESHLAAITVQNLGKSDTERDVDSDQLASVAVQDLSQNGQRPRGQGRILQEAC